MTAVSEQTGAWLAEFTKLPAAEPWVQELREQAFAALCGTRLPHYSRRGVALHECRAHRANHVPDRSGGLAGHSRRNGSSA